MNEQKELNTDDINDGTHSAPMANEDQQERALRKLQAVLAENPKLPAGPELSNTLLKVLAVSKLYEGRGLAQVEAEDKAINEYVRSQRMAGNQAAGERARLTPIVKGQMRANWEGGATEICAREVFDYLALHHNYEAADAKGVGDLLGGQGLRLERKKRKGGGTAYLIPDPEKFPTWYEGDPTLPSSYYSPAGFDDLMRREMRSKKPMLI